MFLNDSKIGFRFGRDQTQDSDPSPLRTAMTATGRPGVMPPPMRLTPAPLDGAATAEAPRAETGAADRALDETTDAPLTLTTPAPTAPVTEPAIGPSPSQPLIAQARAAINQAPAEDEARALDGVLRTIEELSARQRSQDQEVAEARESVARMATEKNRLVEEKARLAEENQQMRDLLSALLRTVEQERRRRTEALSRINARLHDMAGDDKSAGGSAVKAA